MASIPRQLLPMPNYLIMALSLCLCDFVLVAKVGQGSLTWLQGLTELIVSERVNICVFLVSFLY